MGDVGMVMIVLGNTGVAGGEHSLNREVAGVEEAGHRVVA